MAEGIEHLKNGKNDAALECFNIAMKFNHNNVEIYIAKAIALYNIVTVVVNRKIRLKPSNR